MSDHRTILVAYATKKGSTREVAEAIGATLGEHGIDVDIRPAGEVTSLEAYAGVVLGGALYTGRWHADARGFLRAHSEALESIPLTVFAMGPKTLEEDDVADARAQLDSALAKTPTVVPSLVAIFGGVVDPTKLRFPFSRLPATDARDWDAIRAFAEQVGLLLEHRAEVVQA
jgi:menaquinone-dependent protoporphyrinogen oxidase